MTMRSLYILGGYFGIIASLMLLTVASWTPRRLSRYHILAAISLLLTWERMLQYFAWSYKSFYEGNTVKFTTASVAVWLSSTKLFEEAWALVSSTPEGWLISQRICFLTIIWTLFLHQHRHRVPYTWAYMVIAQLVAVSVAMNLYFAALMNNHGAGASKHEKSSTNTLLIQCIAVALISASLVKTLPERFFLPNLLILHAILLFPLLGPRKATGSPTYLCFLITVFSTVSTINCLTKIQSFGAVVDEVGANPAMGSISSDVLLTTISIVIWNRSKPSSLRKSYWSSILDPLIVPQIGEMP